jgi:isochorismate synthase
MTSLEVPATSLEVPATSLAATAVDHAPVDPVGIFGAALEAGLDASLWIDTGGGRSMVGIGSAVSVQPEGPGRFASVGRAWRALVAGIAVEGPAAGSPLAGPMLLGGGAFRTRPSTDPRWGGFPTVAFDVPRVLVASLDDETVVTTIGPTGGLDTLVDVRASGSSDVLPSIEVVALDPDREAWSSSVARITGAVGRGRLDKVVMARRVDLRADRPLDPTTTLRRLATSGRGDPSPGARLTSTVFAFARNGRMFLGSSPERLASVRGRRLRTMALAGTTARGSDALEDGAMGAALLASEKDREEHAVVVAMLRETLEPLVDELALPRVPRIVRSARLQHLLTDAEGTLRDGMRLLEVVERLHPTPAVGGWPTEPALDLLDEESDLDRGWYAGPVGWIDAAGDGDMAVAIRSGLVSGCDASLFAGCGIVADSEPDREWEESALKLRVMGDAIGWSGA